MHRVACLMAEGSSPVVEFTGVWGGGGVCSQARMGRQVSRLGDKTMFRGGALSSDHL